MFSVEEKALLAVGVVSAGFVFIFLVTLLILYFSTLKAVKSIVSGSRRDELRMLESKGSGGRSDSGDDKISSSQSDLLYLEFVDRRRWCVLVVLATFAMVFVELTLLVLVMFDKLPIEAGVIIMTLLGCTYWLSFVTPSNSAIVASTLASNPLNGAARWVRRLWWKLQHKPHYWIPGFIGVAMIVLVLNLSLWGVCENNLKIVNTRLMRRYMEPTCKAGAPCFVYLTIGDDPSNSIIVNYHTSQSASSTQCRYDTKSLVGTNSSGLLETGQQYTMPHLEVARFIHWVHLTNLTPNTTYYFSCGSDAHGWSDERRFKTQSNDPNASYTFVVGGDVDTTEVAESISKIAAQQSPMFALVGGDLAYDRAQYSCYRIVDKWLDTWQKVMVTPEGNSIPIVSAVGNHEVIGDYQASRDRIPFYLRYFPQMSKENDPGQDVDSRPSYGALTIGGPNGTVIMRLDSGHIADATLSKQADYMSNAFDNQFKNSLYRFALYHVPAYPTIRAYTTKYSADIREKFVPVFDKYKFQISFENHDHAYKRSLPLYADEIASTPTDGKINGTVYMGDGNWGVSSRTLPSSRWYQAFTAKDNYILRVDITPKEITYKALNVENNVFDHGAINQS